MAKRYDPLWLIARIAANSCERLTTGPGSCWRHHEWSPDAPYTADRWCAPCIALKALGQLQKKAK